MPIVNAIQACIGGAAPSPPLGAVGVCYSDVINSQEAQAARATALAARQTAFMNVVLWKNVLASIANT